MKLVGKVKEAHGLKGDIYVMVFSGDISWLPKLKEFSLKQTKADLSSLQNYSVQRVKPFKQGFIVKAAEIEDRNTSEELKGREFYIPEELLVSQSGEDIYLGEILNFNLKDPAQKTLGKVVGFSSNGTQDLLQIETTEGRVAEVPFVEAFLKKIDFKNQNIVMDLPEGLLNLDEVES